VGTLFVVATPIGNLSDITLRALEVLKTVDVVLAEDTRVASKLLNHFQILPPKLVSYHQHSSDEKKAEVLSWLCAGKNVALITDAGTPGISDPGNELIDFLFSEVSLAGSFHDREAPAEGASLVSIPGASALTSALSVCGFDVNHFIFLGFLPKKKREKLFKWLSGEASELAFAFYDSPYRIIKTIDDLERHFPTRRIFVARELTKMYETMYRGSISDVRVQMAAGSLKGEFVIVVEKEKRTILAQV